MKRHSRRGIAVTDLENRFHADMLKIYEDAKRDAYGKPHMDGHGDPNMDTHSHQYTETDAHADIYAKAHGKPNTDARARALPLPCQHSQL